MIHFSTLPFQWNLHSFCCAIVVQRHTYRQKVVEGIWWPLFEYPQAVWLMLRAGKKDRKRSEKAKNIRGQTVDRSLVMLSIFGRKCLVLGSFHSLAVFFPCQIIKRTLKDSPEEAKLQTNRTKVILHQLLFPSPSPFLDPTLRAVLTSIRPHV